MANEVKVVVGADTKGAESAMQRFSEKTRKAGLALAALGAGGVLAIKGFTGAALEQEKAMKVLSAVMDNVGLSFNRLQPEIMAATSALQRKTNFGDEVQLRALAKLIALSGDYRASLAALGPMMDMATAIGMDLNAASVLLGRGLAGNTTMFTRYGIQVAKGTKPMELLTLLTEKFGGAAEANIDPFTQMNNAIGDTNEVIGSGLLPLITPLTDKLTDIHYWLQDNVNPAIVKWASITLVAATAVGVLGGATLLTASIIPKLFLGLKMLTTATIGFNKAILMNPVVLVFAAVAGAVALFVTMWAKNMGSIRDKARSAFAGVGDFLAGAINKMISTLQAAAEKMAFLLPEGISQAIRNIKPVESQAAQVFDNMVEATDEMATSVAGAFKKFAFGAQESSDAIEILDEDIQKAKNLLAGLPEVVNRVPTAFEKVKPKVEDAFDWTGLINNVVDNLNILGMSAEDDFMPLVRAMEAAGADTQTAWQMAADRVAGEVRNKFKAAMDDIAFTAEEKADRIAAAARKARNAWAAIHGDFGGELGFQSRLVGVGGWGSIMKEREALVAGGMSVGKAHIEAVKRINEGISGVVASATENFQHGGRVGGPEGQPTLATVHGGELVLNRSQQAALGNTFNITVNGSVDDPREMARLIAEEVDVVMGQAAMRNEQTRSR
jgi:hypothetical protein